MNALEKHADAIFDQAVSLRRQFHRQPELAFSEEKTAALICETLDKWGIPYQKNVAKTGVVAIIKGKQEGKTLLLRADMDALPVHEETGLSFASENENLMHACGHDVHMATLLAGAYIINQCRDVLCGNVKLVFQPAEEGVGGALPMIEAGVMENPKVDAAAALHVTGAVNVGSISLTEGPVMAAPDEFDIIIRGRGGHGGHPDLNIDPIVTAAQFITCVQSVVSRNIPPHQPAAISITSIDGGTNYNIIPDEVHLRGTARSTDPEIRKMLSARIEQILSGVTKAQGAEYEYVFRHMYPPTINDQAMNRVVEAAAEKIVGKDNIVHCYHPSMAGEDFAYFAELVPATYFHLGVANPDKGIVYPIHNCKFDVDEQALKTGSLLFAQIALDYLK